MEKKNCRNKLILIISVAALLFCLCLLTINAVRKQNSSTIVASKNSEAANSLTTSANSEAANTLTTSANSEAANTLTTSANSKTANTADTSEAPDAETTSDAPDYDSTATPKEAATSLGDQVLSNVQLSSVLVESGNLYGCGNIWKIDESGITIITALHVIDDERNIAVTFCDGKKTKAELVKRDEQGDYCFLQLETSKNINNKENKTSKTSNSEYSNDSSSQYKGVNKDNNTQYSETSKNSTQINITANNYCAVKISEVLPKPEQAVFMLQAPAASKSQEALMLQEPEASKSQEVPMLEEPEASISHSATVGVVSSPSTFSEDFDQDVIVCLISVNEGMSGTGLFDLDGNYLGIFLGGTENGEAICLSAQNLN